MKFGKQLQKSQLDIPEYAACFVNYKALKKLIKQLSATPTLQAQHDGASESSDPQVLLQANKATFFFRLERELEKVNTFYLQKQEELELRLKTLLDKKKHLQSRGDSASKNSSTFIALEEGFQQFGNDLNKLQQYVEINNTAFSKILKKWDKTSKSRTKELYLSRAVEVQPCFNREAISELSDQANTSLLDLGAWGEGENVHFDRDETKRTAGPSLGTEERDTDSQFLSTVTNGSLSSLNDWITRLKDSPNARERMTRVFLSAIGDAPEKALVALLETGLVNMHFEDEINERNCLHEAAIFNRAFVIGIALKEGVSVSSVDVYGRIPLHYAAIHGHLDILTKLADADKTTVDEVDHDKYTPLIHAILHEHLQSVEAILKYNARINPSGDSDHIALNLACQRGHSDIVALLLKHRPQILADAEGLYPQHWVAKCGLSPDLLIHLRDYGANLDEPDKINGWTPLFHAASEGHVQCLETLLKCKVSVDVLDEKELPAMYYAAWEGHLGCMSLLEEAGGGLKLSGAGSGDEKAQVVEMSVDQDGIPDLSLPPPILPFRRYGHNFLDSKTFVQLSFEQSGSNALIFYDEGKYPTARLTISSKGSDIIPRNLMLPLTEDTRIISFQVDGLETFALDFDIYPTFGAKMIARTVVPANTFSSGPNNYGRCCLPLFDPRLRSIGQIAFSYQVIQPFRGTPLEITHFATYWKATSHLDSHSNSLITGSSLSGEYVRVLVHLTSDGIPVLYAKQFVTFNQIRVPVSLMTFEELVASLPEADPSSTHAELKKISGNDSAALTNFFGTALLTLKDALVLLPAEVNLDLHVLYASSPKPAPSTLPIGVFDINDYVDAILTDVFDHARDQKDKVVDFMRSILFSSYDAEICTALNWKQPNFAYADNGLDPVFFCNDLGRPAKSSVAGFLPETGRSSTSVKEAVRIAQSNNLMGLICCASMLDMIPALIHAIKVAGLVVVSDATGSGNHTQARPAKRDEDDIDGFLREDGILKFWESIDM